jgi:hypothetical protein
LAPLGEGAMEEDDGIGWVEEVEVVVTEEVEGRNAVTSGEGREPVGCCCCCCCCDSNHD